MNAGWTWIPGARHAALYNVLIQAAGEQISMPGFTGEFKSAGVNARATPKFK